MSISYKSVSEFIGWEKTEHFIQNFIVINKLKSILEIGAGANPTIGKAFITENNLDYTVNDIDLKELNKAGDAYNKLAGDFSLPNISTINNIKFDFIFSRMVGEHISDGRNFYKNVYNLLNQGGYTFHCFSTLYTLPFVLNFILPDSVTDSILRKFAPRDEHKHGKFKAHYNWCRGPSKKMINRFESIGFNVVEYVGYFGHNYYEKIFPLKNLEKLKSKILLKMPSPHFTSYSHVLLKK
jgi:2-polyprenyl-3-methyl-5-hydroxy-6-metoxy-1,4-benzoquinol methylase